MRCSAIYTLRQVKSIIKTGPQAEIRGGWYPARPMSYNTVQRKLKSLWLVWTGKADLFIWPEDQ